MLIEKCSTYKRQEISRAQSVIKQTAAEQWPTAQSESLQSVELVLFLVWAGILLLKLGQSEYVDSVRLNGQIPHIVIYTILHSPLLSGPAQLHIMLERCDTGESLL